MKSTHLLTAMVVLAGFAPSGEAGVFDRLMCRKDAKRCDCDCVPECAPACCKPVIVVPCRTTVHCYQRQCSTLKPPCCNSCCPPSRGCAKCCPVGKQGAAGVCCREQGNGCCEDSCCEGCDACCPGYSCELAQLIYESQTGCYARHRKRAIHRLSDCYDCACYPEVMCALIYALNDADEHVRAKAADEIGDQLRRNPCCCSERVVAALTCALADCHWSVRWQAKQALQQCGYDVVKPRKVGCCEVGCCETGCCETGCCESGCHSGAPANAVAPAPAAPADLPAEEVKEPSAVRTPQRKTAAPAPPKTAIAPPIRQMSGTNSSPARKGLAALFELFD